jgi:glycosyltransferase involved in cell wall biosynthesis
MKVHWFSPLPPAKSGIAVYTSSLIAALQNRADLTLWTDQEAWDADLDRRVSVRRFDPRSFPWSELNLADLIFYNLGNSRPFHQGIWEISRRHSGVVVLHDLCLQHFFADLYLNFWKDVEGYKAQMNRYYGDEGVRAATRYLGGAYTTEQMAELYPMTPLALENALGALVHVRHGLDALKEMGVRPAAWAQLPYLPRTELSGSQKRAKGPPYRLIVFGHLGANRRLDALLEAWAKLPERDLFRLDICGDLLDRKCISRARSLGLERLANVHGYISENDLHEKLAQAHLAVNLRYPSMGEASLSQLQIWEHALPSLVTQVGWYMTCPPDAVGFVRVEREIADIRSHLTALVRFPERFTAMGERGRRCLLDHHSPGLYVDALLSLGAEAQKCRSRSIALRLAEHARLGMGNWAPAGAGRLLAEKLSFEISALTAARAPLTEQNRTRRYESEAAPA